MASKFNKRGELIVCTNEDAFKCFMRTDLYILVCENYILFKEEQDNDLKLSYQKEFELD